MSPRPFALAAAFGLLAAGCGKDDYSPLIIGHRGSPREFPENSHPGFQLAYELGADGIELDVQFTRDAVAVVMHDDDLDRTTDCEGPVRDRSVAELSACPLGNGEPIVPLAELLPGLAGLFQLIFVEVKVPADAFDDAALVALTDGVIDSILAQEHAERFVVISYQDVVLSRLGERRGEGIRGGWDDESRDGISEGHRRGLGWSLMPMRLLEPWMGDVIHGLDGQLAVYVVGSPSDFAVASDAAADALLTDSIRTLAALTGRPTRTLEAP
jgi:glycerophosphoryl diester phosphodiesterase